MSAGEAGVIGGGKFPAAPAVAPLVFCGVTLPLESFALEAEVTLAATVTGLFGSSGAGKTSLLDLVAGLRRPRTGKIALGDEVLADVEAGIFVPPRARHIGFVPQDLALFPHLDVRANLLYGAARRSLAEGDANAAFTFTHVVEVLEVAPLLDRSIATLSGGEQQRVAIARALLSAPRLLLLDEPMSSLDSRLKSRLLELLRRVRTEFSVPMLYVSHDATEIRALCDEVLLVERGRITAQGDPGALLP